MRIVVKIVLAVILISVGAEGHNYSGRWALSPCVDYSCSLLGVAYVDVSFCSDSVLDQYPQITIIAGGGIAGSLHGLFSSPTVFAASLTEPGSCTVVYDLSGEFTSDTTFIGIFQVKFQGSSCGTFTDCTNQTWLISGTRPTPACCQNGTGNVDCSVGDGVDIGDLTTLIDNLFISFAPLCCAGEANCDGVGGVDIGDLTALIDNLFVSFSSLPACQ